MNDIQTGESGKKKLSFFLLHSQDIFLCAHLYEYGWLFNSSHVLLALESTSRYPDPAGGRVGVVQQVIVTERKEV